MADSNDENKGIKQYAVPVIVILVIVGLLYVGLNNNMQSQVTAPTSTPGTTVSTSGPGTMAIQLTDPPVVPSGTQALIVTYSGVDLHETGTSNSTGFVSFSASGTVNLMNLTNVSQTVAIIKTNANQSFNLIRFDIKSATIEINNVTYNVTLATTGVVAAINSSVNSTSNSGVLIDLSPVVLQIYTSSNQSVFVLVPSARAIAIGKYVVGTGLHLGTYVSLRGELAAALYAQRPNISITSATASEAGNVTQLHVTVRNNGNSTVLLSDITLRGFFEAVPAYGSWTPPPGVNVGVAVQGRTNGESKIPGGTSLSGASTTALWSNGAYINASANASGAIAVNEGPWLNSSLNSTIEADVHASLSASGVGGALYTALRIGAAEIFNRNFHNQLNFVVESNGTLELPYGIGIAECPAILVSTGTPGTSAQGCTVGIGYSLSPGASATFSFSGVITMPNVGVVISPALGMQVNASGSANWIGPRVGSAVVLLIPNQTYKLVVHGYRGAYASANVTATGYAENFSASLVDVTNVDLALHNTVSGATYNETMAGFISHTNSNVSYSVYSYGGPYVVALPALPSYGINVTGFQVNTPGFTLLGYSAVGFGPQCPVCNGRVCPDIACVGGTGKIYLLSIRTPPTNYTGALSITEDYSAPAAQASVTSRT